LFTAVHCFSTQRGKDIDCLVILIGLKMARNFDSTLSTIMLQVNGDTEEFLGIVFDYMNRKTDFAKQDNILAKEKVMQAVDKHILPPKSDSKKQIDNWSSYEGFPDEATISEDDLLEHIELGANLSETSVIGDNFMHLAAIKGWQEAVEKLNKVDETMKNAQMKDGVTTPLMYAAIGKNSGIVKFLLEQGANPKIVDALGSNILHYSCTFGDLQGVKMLVEGDFGMNINEKTKDGRTPLKWALVSGRNDIVSFLESKGAKMS